MPTPRKTKLRQVEIGPRVSSHRAEGRPVDGVAYTRAVAARVEAVRDRLEGNPDESTSWRRLTWRSFAERIGLSAQALRDRRRGIVQFSLHDLARICHEFDVRAEYLLRGEGSMLHIDAPRDPTSAGLADMLHHHVTELLSVKLEQDPAWVASHLPNADVLLEGVERGVGDALDSHVESGIGDRVLANTIREAVASRLRSAPARSVVPDSFLLDVGKGKLVGPIIDIGTRSKRQSVAGNKRVNRDSDRDE